MCREIELELGYKLSEALYPVNPLLLPKATVTDADIELLKQWNSVRNGAKDSILSSVMDSVRNGVGDSVWYGVWYGVRDSVWYGVGNGVWDSVWYGVGAYIGSLFPGINKWKYKNHEQGQYPFQSAVNLWHRGLVPSFDGKIWRLHSGEKAEVVWEEPEAGWLKARDEK